MELACSQTLSFWSIGNFNYPVFNDPVHGCDYLYSDFNWPQLSSSYRPDRSFYYAPDFFVCGIQNDNKTWFGGFTFVTVTCDDGLSYDFNTRSCQVTGQRGGGQDPLVCPSVTPSG